MALTQSQVSALYVAIFGRASEGEANKKWQKSASLVDVAKEMLKSDEAKKLFGTSLDSDKAFIDFIYANVLGKGAGIDQAGKDFWANKLKAGSDKAAIMSDIIHAAMDTKYASSSDTATKNAFNLFVNKVALSNIVSETVEKLPEGGIKALQAINKAVKPATKVAEVKNLITANETLKSAVDTTKLEKAATANDPAKVIANVTGAKAEEITKILKENPVVSTNDSGSSSQGSSDTGSSNSSSDSGSTGSGSGGSSGSSSGGAGTDDITEVSHDGFYKFFGTSSDLTLKLQDVDGVWKKGDKLYKDAQATQEINLADDASLSVVEVKRDAGSEVSHYIFSAHKSATVGAIKAWTDATLLVGAQVNDKLIKGGITYTFGSVSSAVKITSITKMSGDSNVGLSFAEVDSVSKQADLKDKYADGAIEKVAGALTAANLKALIANGNALARLLKDGAITAIDTDVVDASFTTAEATAIKALSAKFDSSIQSTINGLDGTANGGSSSTQTATEVHAESDGFYKLFGDGKPQVKLELDGDKLFKKGAELFKAANVDSIGSSAETTLPVLQIKGISDSTNLVLEFNEKKDVEITTLNSDSFDKAAALALLDDGSSETFKSATGLAAGDVDVAKKADSFTMHASEKLTVEAADVEALKTKAGAATDVFAVSDTAENIKNALDSLVTHAVKVASINASNNDGEIAMTKTQFDALKDKLDAGDTIKVTDLAAGDVAIAKNGKVDSFTMDSGAKLTVEAADVATLTTKAGNGVLAVSDTAASITNALADLVTHVAKVASINASDDGSEIEMTKTQFDALKEKLTDNNDTIKVTGLAAGDVAASAAKDVFKLGVGATGLNITGFAAADKIDVTALIAGQTNFAKDNVTANKVANGKFYVLDGIAGITATSLIADDFGELFGNDKTFKATDGADAEAQAIVAVKLSGDAGYKLYAINNANDSEVANIAQSEVTLVGTVVGTFDSNIEANFVLTGA